LKHLELVSLSEEDGMATILDVARKAGVSAGSVSRVFRGAANVAPETGRAVRAAAKALGYVHPSERRPSPHGLPVALRRVGLVTIGMAHSLSRLPVVASLLEGAAAELETRGLVAVSCDAPDPSSVPAALRAGQVDGLLLKAGLEGSEEDWSKAPVLEAARRFPHVWILGRPAGARGDMVGSDDAAVGRMAAERLVSRGHRRVAFLSPKSDHRLFVDREVAFLGWARRLGAEAVSVTGPRNPKPFPIRPVGDVETVAALLERALKARATAVFVPADSVAALLYRAMAERRLRPGRDLAVVSCNHEALIRDGLTPALTTIDIHAAAIGARGVDQLYWRSARPADPHESSVLLAPTLVEGASA
jgi:DNA-binding LacI/PurR family transcriptional regulator